MNTRHITILLAVFVALLLAAAGCTDTTDPLPFVSTATPTTVPTTAAAVSTLPTLSPTPSPTEVLPDVWAVDVQVQSNGQAINPLVVMTFRGGMGMNLIPELDLEVIRSDGIVETGNMKQPLYVGKTSPAGHHPEQRPGRSLGDHATGRPGQDHRPVRAVPVV
jgi:hypothetical protein